MSDPFFGFEVDGDPVGPPCIPACDDGDRLACAADECPNGEPWDADPWEET